MAESSQIIEVDMDDETDRTALQAQVQAVLTGTDAVLTLVDRKGKELSVSAARVGWVELGSIADDRRIGFGA